MESIYIRRAEGRSKDYGKSTSQKQWINKNPSVGQVVIWFTDKSPGPQFREWDSLNLACTPPGSSFGIAHFESLCPCHTGMFSKCAQTFQSQYLCSPRNSLASKFISTCSNPTRSLGLSFSTCQIGKKWMKSRLISLLKLCAPVVFSPPLVSVHMNLVALGP